MNLLIVALEDQEHVEDFLSVLVELDVAGLQIMDSLTVMEMLAREAPIFAGLRKLITRPKAESKIILGITEQDSILPKLDKLLKKIGFDLNKPGFGYAVLLRLTDSIGQLTFDDE